MITLTTDLGYKDPFVGMMKGVILGINPDVRIIDITHGIGRHNIMEAALVVSESYGYFPGKSIHIVVVDPGVGSNRRPILVEADMHLFIGPDNGVFSKIFKSCKDHQVMHITSGHYFLQSPGSTFHGRDVFAPVAAWLSKGVTLENFGERITDYVKFMFPDPSAAGGRVNGEVIHIDRFGNVITNISKQDIETIGSGPLKVLVKDRHIDIKNYYSEAGDREPHALINSSGLLEIFIYMGNASNALNIKTGDPVSVGGA